MRSRKCNNRQRNAIEDEPAHVAKCREFDQALILNGFAFKQGNAVRFSAMKKPVQFALHGQTHSHGTGEETKTDQ